MRVRSVALFVVFLATATVASSQVDPALYGELRWRHIGPFRGGRTVAAMGVPSQPSVFYIGVNNGGVWKSTDYGRVWLPIFDDQPTRSIGAAARAPAHPHNNYARSGQGPPRAHLPPRDRIQQAALA